jgi:hypothetical protein
MHVFDARSKMVEMLFANEARLLDRCDHMRIPAVVLIQEEDGPV